MLFEWKLLQQLFLWGERLEISNVLTSVRRAFHMMCWESLEAKVKENRFLFMWIKDI